MTLRNIPVLGLAAVIIFFMAYLILMPIIVASPAMNLPSVSFPAGEPEAPDPIITSDGYILNPIYQPLYWTVDPRVEVLPGHADARHGADADAARTCSNNPNALRVYNSLTKRRGFLCFLADNRIGIHFLDDMDREITAYVLNKVSTFEKALECLENAGFYLLQ